MNCKNCGRITQGYEGERFCNADCKQVYELIEEFEMNWQRTHTHQNN